MWGLLFLQPYPFIVKERETNENDESTIEYKRRRLIWCQNSDGGRAVGMSLRTMHCGSSKLLSLHPRDYFEIRGTSQSRIQVEKKECHSRIVLKPIKVSLKKSLSAEWCSGRKVAETLQQDSKSSWMWQYQKLPLSSPLPGWTRTLWSHLFYTHRCSRSNFSTRVYFHFGCI